MNFTKAIQNLQKSVSHMQLLISRDKKYTDCSIDASIHNTSKAQQTADNATQLANTNTQSIIEAQQTITDMDIAQIETEIAYTDMDLRLLELETKGVS